MNKKIKACVVLFAVALSFVSNSCDKFDTLPLNIPFSVTVVTQGSSNPTAANPVSYCLNQSETYSDYANDITKLTFVEAAFRTDSVKNITAGNVTVTVEILGSGTILFQKTLTGINPANYKSPNAPFVLPLTASEITALNTYLENYRANPSSAPCIRASVQADVTTGTPPYYLRVFVDMVVEAETKL